MSLVKWAFIGIVMLPAAEIGVFLLLAVLIGWLWTIALFLGTSVAGVILLRRSGRSDFDRLRAALAQDGWRALHLETPGFGGMLGGILLVFPGFITDLLGLALMLPPFRRWAGAVLTRATRRRRRAPDGVTVIDLEPNEWQQITDQRPKRPRKAGRREAGRRKS
jgi:UPF0716 protein FxsA